MTWSRLLRFNPTSSPTTTLIGQPVSPDQDIGLSLYHHPSTPIEVTVFTGSSILAPGAPTSPPRTETIATLLSPLAPNELGGGCIRCIGLNYRAHAAEAGLELPGVPPVFIKPGTALADPHHPATGTGTGTGQKQGGGTAEVKVKGKGIIPLPKVSRETQTADWESELAVVLGREVKNVDEKEAMSAVLGYTAANDVSCRSAQFAQSQWCYSKGFDGGCPLGPVIVSPAALPDPTKLTVRGLLNGEERQPATPISDLVFPIPHLISFLSQSTTLPAGTVILTGTPAGVGFSKKPPQYLKDGDVFSVEISPLVGTLVSLFEDEV